MECQEKGPAKENGQVYCFSVAASQKQEQFSYNGSTLSGIRADKVTHEWINDCKKPT